MTIFYLVKQEAKNPDATTDKHTDYEVTTLFFRKWEFTQAYNKFIVLKCLEYSTRLILCIVKDHEVEEIHLVEYGSFHTDIPF